MIAIDFHVYNVQQ